MLMEKIIKVVESCYKIDFIAFYMKDINDFILLNRDILNMNMEIEGKRSGKKLIEIILPFVYFDKGVMINFKYVKDENKTLVVNSIANAIFRSLNGLVENENIFADSYLGVTS